MEIKSVTKMHLNPSGYTDNIISPQESTQPHPNGEQNDVDSIFNNRVIVFRGFSQKINGFFYHPWDKNLQTVHSQQTNDTDDKMRPVFFEIIKNQLKRTIHKILRSIPVLS